MKTTDRILLNAENQVASVAHTALAAFLKSRKEKNRRDYARKAMAAACELYNLHNKLHGAIVISDLPPLPHPIGRGPGGENIMLLKDDANDKG